jgi:hypothetical protein
MMVVLNILAALMLTILPALKPCDCNGFSFVCACALKKSYAKAGAPADNAKCTESEPHCCCKKSKTPKVGESRSVPELPAPRKHGNCLKFAVYNADLAVADQVLLNSEVLPVVFLPAPAVHLEVPLVSLPKLHCQRPPPYGLIVALTRHLRI